jgi:hypothetical protein
MNIKKLAIKLNVLYKNLFVIVLMLETLPMFIFVTKVETYNETNNCVIDAFNINA